MHNLFGAYRNLHDTTRAGYERYLNAQYKDRACCCGVTPNMFTPMFQTFANKLLGIKSFEEWKAEQEDHNRFIVEYRLTEDAVIVSRPGSTEPPVATRVTWPWEIL